VCGEDTNPICAFNSDQIDCPMANGHAPYACRYGIKRYRGIFPEVNTDALDECDGRSCNYCDCEESDVMREHSGLTGTKCDIEFSICEDGAQVCFHGAPCISVRDEYVCGCPYTTDPLKTYLGEHCEYEASEFCSTSKLSTSKKFDVSESGAWFCTSNGRCQDGAIDPEEICNCDAGYYGLHCEYKDKRPKCELKCENGGVCDTGIKDYSEYDDAMIGFLTDDDFERSFNGETVSHCICPAGYTGTFCERQTKDCGEGVCLNGASCRTGIAGFYCDCTDINLTGPNGKVIPHAGPSCERVASTMCDAMDGFPSEEYFCTNGSKCPKDLHLPCICLEGFSGPRCEFKGVDKKVCSLACENNGHCFFGETPETSPYDSFDISSPSLISGMHCKCPSGYAGFLCETAIEVCGNFEHHCKNSGKCVIEGNEYTCDCDNDSTDTSYAGVNCENPATSFCIGPGASKEFFCTNEGVCVDVVVAGTTAHPGCDCDSGYFGEYCELNDKRNVHGTASKAFLGFTISILGIFGIFLGGYYYHTNSPDGGQHNPIGVPPDIHARDCDSGYDNTVYMDE